MLNVNRPGDGICSIRKPSGEMIAFDEAGATGVDLLNVDQPVFVLASFFLDHEASMALLDGLPKPIVGELHFSSAKKNPDGRANICALVDELLSGELSDRVRVSVAHKKFMLVAKLVDGLLEKPMRARGFDIYRNHWHVIASNILLERGTLAIGYGLWNQLLITFKMAATSRDTRWGRNLIDVLCAARGGCRDPQIAALLDVMPRSLDDLDKTGLQSDPHDTQRSAIDPAVALLMEQLNAWGIERGSDVAKFPMVHDQGAVGPQRWLRLFELAMNASPGTVDLPVGAGVLAFPVAGTNLTFGNSANVPQLQVADIAASAVNHALSAQVSGRSSDLTFAETLQRIGITQLVGHSIWPTIA